MGGVAGENKKQKKAKKATERLARFRSRCIFCAVFRTGRAAARRAFAEGLKKRRVGLRKARGRLDYAPVV